MTISAPISSIVQISNIFFSKFDEYRYNVIQTRMLDRSKIETRIFEIFSVVEKVKKNNFDHFLVVLILCCNRIC